MKNIFRTLFLATILTELLAWAGVVPLPDPTFTWFGLVGTAIAAWLFLEIGKFPAWLWAIGWGDILLDAASDVYHLYARWAPAYPWDRFMHVLGGFVVALFALELVLRSFRAGSFSARNPLLVIVLATVLITGFAGYAYEAWEYITDVVYTKKSVALGDGKDTVDDMNLNLLGALIALGTQSPRLRKIRRAG